jgi:hypothetical protein
VYPDPQSTIVPQVGQALSLRGTPSPARTFLRYRYEPCGDPARDSRRCPLDRSQPSWTILLSDTGFSPSGAGMDVGRSCTAIAYREGNNHHWFWTSRGRQTSCSRVK